MFTLSLFESLFAFAHWCTGLFSEFLKGVHRDLESGEESLGEEFVDQHVELERIKCKPLY
jgi:hypothetical protein